MDVITTIIEPAESYDLAVLADVKTDLGISGGTTFTTSADVLSGLLLPFAATLGIAAKQSVTGPNIPAGAIVTGVSTTSVTISAAVTGDVAAGTAIIFGAVAADDFLIRAITLASTAIQNYCNRKFAVETIQDQFNFFSMEYGAGLSRRQEFLTLSKGPLIEIESVSVEEDGVTMPLVAGTDYELDLARGQLIRLSANTGRAITWPPRMTTVLYTAGYETIPPDLNDACSRLVQRAYWARGRDPALMERNQGQVGSERFWVSTVPDGNLPPDVCELINNYRLITVA